MQMVDGSTVSVDNIDVVGRIRESTFRKREMGTAQDNGAVAGYPFQGKKFSEIGLYHGSFKDESLRKLNNFGAAIISTICPVSTLATRS